MTTPLDALLADVQRASAADEARRVTWPKCATCNEPADPAFGSRCGKCTEASARQRTVESVIGRSNIPARYDATIGSRELAERVRDGHAIALARQWSGVDRLVLVGESGVGKTTLAAALLRHRVTLDERVTSALFVDAVELASVRRRASFGRETELERAALETRLLVLDDLGQEGKGGTEAVASIVFQRHARRRPMILTTWMSGTQLAELYGAGVARRICLDGARVIAMTRGAR